MEASATSWFDNKNKEEIIKEIQQLRKNIKQKHRAMKRDILESEEILEKQFKPIVDPLRKLVEESEKIQQSSMEDETQSAPTSSSVNYRKRRAEETDEDDETSPAKRYVLPPPQGVKRKHGELVSSSPLNYRDQDGDEIMEARENESLVFPTAKRAATHDSTMEGVDENTVEDMEAESSIREEDVFISEPGEVLLATPQGKDAARQYIENTFKGRLAKEYFLKLIKNGKDMDHNYGVRVDGNAWMLGDKPIDVFGDDLVIDGRKYEGTRGLYELIFMNVPNPYVYSEEDLDTYAMILKQTNVHKVGYSSVGRVKSNRGKKYTKIISKIVERHTSNLEPMMTYSDIVNQATSGSGLQVTDNTKPDILYYDDPNELVDRYRLLHASEQSGNTGHANEINAILEELLELDQKMKNDIGKGLLEYK